MMEKRILSNPENIGKLIKEVRQKKGLTQAELGELIGCRQTTVAEWENKVYRLPGRKYLKRVAQVLGVSVDYLVGSEKVDNPQIPCYGEITSERFKWTENREIKTYLDIPQSEYKQNRFSFQIMDELLEPVIYKRDYAIFEKLKPEDGDIVLVRFYDKEDESLIRMWRQQDNLVVLSGINLSKICPPVFMEIREKKQNRTFYVTKGKSEFEVGIEGRLVAVKRILKSVAYDSRINYIFS